MGLHIYTYWIIYSQINILISGIDKSLCWILKWFIKKGVNVLILSVDFSLSLYHSSFMNQLTNHFGDIMQLITPSTTQCVHNISICVRSLTWFECAWIKHTFFFVHRFFYLNGICQSIHRKKKWAHRLFIIFNTCFSIVFSLSHNFMAIRFL